MDKHIWLQSYPQGVPAEIQTEGITSLAQMLETACSQFANKVAFISMGKEMTYRQLEEESRAFAGWLQSMGLQKGDRVALMMPNVLQYPVALLGTLRAGCVVVNINPLYTARELEHQLKDAEATAIVILENFACTLQKVIANTSIRHVVVTSAGDLLGPVKGRVLDFVLRRIKKKVPDWNLPDYVGFKAALAAGRAHGFQQADLQLGDMAFLQYTGGTSGVSKGAVLTHGNIAANVLQGQAWVRPVIHEGQEGQDECIITALPLYHIFALTVNCLLFMKLGARNLLIANPRDTSGLIKEWSKHHVTVVTGVNTLYNTLVSHEDFQKLNFSNMKLALGAGMAVQTPVAEQWLKTVGVPLLQAYGLTETSPAATVNPVDVKNFSGSVGLPISSTIVSIRNDDGNEVPNRQVGEICIYGPQVMHGYWRRPDETEKTFYPDGFFRTGDVGYIDAKGFIFLVDRKKDMILVSGFNVYPNEVEEAVVLHPGVADVAAIGVPDQRSGEVVKIFVVRKDPQLTEADLIAHCRQQLTGYKMPRHVEFRDDLPRSNVGKILRRALKEEG